MTDSRLPDRTPIDASIRYTAFRWLVPLVSLVLPGAIATAIAALVLPITGGLVIENNALVATSTLGQVWRIIAGIVVLATIAYGMTSAAAAIIVRAHGRYISPLGAWRIAGRRARAIATLTLGLTVAAAAVEALRIAPSGEARGWLMPLWVLACMAAITALLPRWVTLVARPVDGKREHAELKISAMTQLLWLGLAIGIGSIVLPLVVLAPRTPWLHTLMWVAVVLISAIFVLAALAAAARGRLADQRLELLTEQEKPAKATPIVALVAVAAVALAPVLTAANLAGIAQFSRIADDIPESTLKLTATQDRVLATHRSGGLAWCDPFSCTGSGRIEYSGSMVGTADSLRLASWQAVANADGDRATMVSLFTLSYPASFIDSTFARHRWADLTNTSPILRLTTPAGITVRLDPYGANVGVMGQASKGSETVFVGGFQASGSPESESNASQALLALARCENTKCEDPVTDLVALDNMSWSNFSSLNVALGNDGTVAVLANPQDGSDTVRLVTGSLGEKFDSVEIRVPEFAGADLRTSLSTTADGLPVILVSSDADHGAILIRCADVACQHDQQEPLPLPVDSVAGGFILDEKDRPVIPFEAKTADNSFDLRVMGCQNADCSEHTFATLIAGAFRDDDAPRPPRVTSTSDGNLVISSATDRDQANRFADITRVSTLIWCTTARCGA